MCCFLQAQGLEKPYSLCQSLLSPELAWSGSWFNPSFPEQSSRQKWKPEEMAEGESRGTGRGQSAGSGVVGNCAQPAAPGPRQNGAGSEKGGIKLAGEAMRQCKPSMRQRRAGQSFGPSCGRRACLVNSSPTAEPVCLHKVQPQFSRIIFRQVSAILEGNKCYTVSF